MKLSIVIKGRDADMLSYVIDIADYYNEVGYPIYRKSEDITIKDSTLQPSVPKPSTDTKDTKNSFKVYYFKNIKPINYNYNTQNAIAERVKFINNKRVGENWHTIKVDEFTNIILGNLGNAIKATLSADIYYRNPTIGNHLVEALIAIKSIKNIVGSEYTNIYIVNNIEEAPEAFLDAIDKCSDIRYINDLDALTILILNRYGFTERDILQMVNSIDN